MDNRDISNGFLHENTTSSSNENPPILKRKRNLPGNPDPEAEVISLSPKTLMATNRFVCEICLKGFQRDQNLQLHRRGHNLPWKLKQRTSKEIRKRVYVCPEKTCVHNHPSRALGDLTGIKKHFCRKHGEKKWKCEKCSKFYAVQSDMKAHSKTCGTREYKCDCGTIFSRRDSFVTHRAFCDALAEETARINGSTNSLLGMGGNNIANYNIMQNSLIPNIGGTHFSSIFKPNSCTNQETTNQTSRSGLSLWMSQTSHDTILANNNNLHETYHQNWVFGNKFSSNNESQELTSSVSLPLVNNNNIDKDSANENNLVSVPSLYSSQHQSQSNHQITTFANMSATALLQKAAQIGTTTSTDSLYLGSLGLRCNSPSQDHGNKFCGVFTTSDHGTAEYYSGELSQMPPTKRRRVQNEENVWGQTRDFLGVGGANHLHPFIHQKMDLI
ncbi:zinc finger protein MAGPIE-like [Trifolium pratense]|uniref:zinc finger protein MAGPIE-like n=1 Tax=Trifolium pratense TaxID=57577 RepID=UPI001E6918C5|nr:zinc finger protein MAGPIE-like [Trifolium pratense]